MFMTMATAETWDFLMLGKLMLSISCKVGGIQSYQMKDYSFLGYYFYFFYFFIFEGNYVQVRQIQGKFIY